MGWRQACMVVGLLGGAMASDDLLCMPNLWSGRYFKNAIMIRQDNNELERGSLSEGWATFDVDKGYMAATETGDNFAYNVNPEPYSLTIYQKGVDSYVSIASPPGIAPTCYQTNLTDRVPESRCLTKVSQKWTEKNFNMPSGGMYNGKYAQFAVINNDTHKSKNESVQIGFLEEGTNFPLTATLAEYDDLTGIQFAEIQMAAFSNSKAEFNKTLFQLPKECSPLSVVRGPEADQVAVREFRRVWANLFGKKEKEQQREGRVPQRKATEQPKPKKQQQASKEPLQGKPEKKATKYCHVKDSSYEMWAPTFFGGMIGNISLSYEAAGASRFGFKGTLLFNERAVDVRLIQYNGGPHGRIWFEYKDIFAPPNLPPFNPNIPYSPTAPTPAESGGGYVCNVHADGRYYVGLERCRNTTGPPKKVEVNGRPAEVYKLQSVYDTGFFSIPIISESYVLQGADGLMLGFMNLTSPAEIVDWSGAANLFNPRPVADEAVLTPPEHCENNYLPVPHDPSLPVPTPFLEKEKRQQEQEEYDYTRAPRLLNTEEEAGDDGNDSSSKGSLSAKDQDTIIRAILSLVELF